MAAAIGSLCTTSSSVNLRQVSCWATPSAFSLNKGLSDGFLYRNASSSLAMSRSMKSSAVIRAAAVAAPPTFKTLKPLGDRILVKIHKVEEKSEGGIILPTTNQSKPQGGEVIEVGDGKKVGEKKLPPCVNVGNTIVYSKYAGTEVQFNGADHILLKEDDVIGLLSTEDIQDLKPLNDRVLIKVAQVEEKTAGGVLLTEGAKEKPVIGEVVGVGPGSYGEDGNRKALDVSRGNTVLYSKYAGNDFESKDGSKYVVLRVSDVLAVLS